MKWTHPHISKLYEALGAISDGRVEIDPDDSHKAKVHSSSRGKYYEVSYDPENQTIMANDNAAYWQGTLWYTAIAYLLSTGNLPLNIPFSVALAGIPWKDMNVKNKNDFDRTIVEVDKLLTQKWIDMEEFKTYLEDLNERIQKAEYGYLGKKTLPPKGY